MLSLNSVVVVVTETHGKLQRVIPNGLAYI
jgi:hypothetical protein